MRELSRWECKGSGMEGEWNGGLKVKCGVNNWKLSGRGRGREWLGVDKVE